MRNISIEISEQTKNIIELATGTSIENILEQIKFEILKDNEAHGKISVCEAAKRMNKSPQFVRMGLQQGTLPFGAAVKMPGGKYSYYISPKKFYEYVGNTENN
ncbi:MAG: hypothetical protein J6A61_08825 [Clostridia bacterium]|nr:hypothetical protein [Clostridia bacterium]